MRVSIDVFPASQYVVELEFSERDLEIDPAIADDCEVLGTVFSKTFNADAGFEAGDLDAAAWQSEVESASALLDAMHPSPAIGTQIEAVATWLAGASTPGDLTTNRSAAANAAFSLIGQICTGNNTGLLLIGEYGG